MSEPSLFPYLDPPVRDVPDETLSAGRRLTLRQKTDVERGVHPLTRGPLREPAGELCGTCRFRIIEKHKSRSYPKCHFKPGDVWSPPYPRSTSGPASDVRAWWPACTDWQWDEEHVIVDPVTERTAP